MMLVHTPKRTVILAAVGVSLTIIVVIFLVDRLLYLKQFDSGAFLPSATIISGQTGNIIEGKELSKLAEENSYNYRHNDTSSALAYDKTLTYDKTGNVVLTLYYRAELRNEILSATIRNNSTQQITIVQMDIDGFYECISINCPSGVRGAVISAPGGIIAPRIDHPILLKAGEVITAYIEGDFRMPHYGAGICYSYDMSDPNTRYCGSTFYHPVR